MVSKWLIGFYASFFGLILGQFITLYTFHESQKSTKEVAEIQLVRDLYKEFYFQENIYKDIRLSIERCEPLYISWGGKYSHDDINRYLGFFSDLGYFYKKEILSKDILAHLFAAYAIEAYENKELRKYISNLRSNFSQPQAFENFEFISKEFGNMKEFLYLNEIARKMCQ